MGSEPMIHDLYIRRLSEEESGTTSRLPLLRFEDHLLRRVGSAELVKIRSDHPVLLQVRSVADEVWVNIRGQVKFIWLDMRSISPTSGQEYSIECTEPTLVLAPFGVAFGYQCLEDEAWLVRIATHSETEVDSESIRIIERNG
jgi:hypothetical protein